ncbi:hypothetical protein ASF72_01505 [Arthrobacter sp. Leaf141]|uniref:hypothetical protein n=1 Tax=Arthrobacter sp. Leaf141 TaxID=1736273 RepID=UPI0006F7A793|nr:hypothetical protein [Arthrobacter sp. Leaf141]KQQ96364.1 hypothetical protein ASF72_01505 [Arthrobacter sp. Leaf141]
MRTAESLTEPEQLHRLLENLAAHVARGREWATPGVQAALQRAVVGLDAGIETASPRLQVLLRRLADDMAGGVETLTPRVQERLRQVGPKTDAEVTAPAGARWGALLKWGSWLGALVVLSGAGVLIWRSLWPSEKEPAPSMTVPKDDGADIDADPDLTAGRI